MEFQEQKRQKEEAKPTGQPGNGSDHTANFEGVEEAKPTGQPGKVSDYIPNLEEIQEVVEFKSTGQPGKDSEYIPNFEEVQERAPAGEKEEYGKFRREQAPKDINTCPLDCFLKSQQKIYLVEKANLKNRLDKIKKEVEGKFKNNPFKVKEICQTIIEETSHQISIQDKNLKSFKKQQDFLLDCKKEFVRTLDEIKKRFENAIDVMRKESTEFQVDIEKQINDLQKDRKK